MKPITPAEVGPAKLGVTPPEVIQAFNELIAAHWDGSSATVTQGDVIDRLAKLMHPHGFFTDRTAGTVIESEWRQSVFAKGWLNVEALYRSAGWKVVYDKPGYDEGYPARFVFSCP